MTMFLKRKPGLTREEFRDHHINRHGELMRSIPEAEEHLIRYTQVHPGAQTTSAVPLSDFDSVAELWFDSMDGLEAVMGSATFADDVAPDEENFLDREAITVVVGEMHPVIGGPDSEAAATPLPSTAGGEATLPRGINHIGITVPDIEAATRFFVDAFGAKVAYDGLVTSEPPRQGSEVEDLLGMPSGSAIVAQRMIQIGTGPPLEVFQVADAEQQPAAGLADLGLEHISLFVDDMGAALERALSAGATAQSEPHPNSRHEDTPGNASVYLHAPWGTLIELQALPEGHWYDDDSQTTVWTPPARISRFH